jgi:methylenetetrahydrofolate--tRNA-(uracil-5-)-methyltransferase
MISKPIHVIGGGLAGCEAAWQLARRNHDVLLYDMKPLRFSPAHQSPHLAELVCSNSLRSNVPESAAGLLKEEMRALNSLIMEAADKTAVPAGKALAVDRNAFSLYIEEKLTLQKSLEVVHKEVITIPEDAVTIIATGPLTSDALSTQIASLTGREHLAFYDAIAPIVEADSIDYSLVFRASRYDHADGDYLNCPMTEEEYRHFCLAYYVVVQSAIIFPPFFAIKFLS